jgi:L,D-transpeptidase ErfK/SrfK
MHHPRLSPHARFAPLALLAAMVATAPQSGAAVFELPANNSTVFGSVQVIKAVYEDTLSDLARKYSLGWEEIIRANPKVDPWLPGAGADILIPGQRILPPGPHEGIVVNLPEHRLYYFPKPKRGEKPIVITYPVSIGKMDWRTPLGRTSVADKRKNPLWNPPESVRKEHEANGDPLPKVVPAGPDNPLGAFAMRLAIPGGSYLIHGTNNPAAVGMAITHGCIRMYPEDVESLFPLVAVGTPVWLINEPIKFAWLNGELLIEVHPPVNAEGQTVEPNLEEFSKKLNDVLGPATAAVNWDIAIAELKLARGIPTLTGLEAQLDAPVNAAAPAGPAEPPPAAAATAPAPPPAADAAPAPHAAN